MLSFGQALYFGFGMYGVGIGIDQLHLTFWPAFGLGIVAAVTMALVSGVFAVRLTWHYFAIITVVFSLIFYFIAVRVKPLTGGDDGINFSMPPTFTFGRSVWSFTDPTFQYFFILAVVALCFYLMHRVIRSPLGKAFVAIRDNDVRASLIGINVFLVRLTAFVMAGFLAGVAGALFAFFGRYASATYMFYQVSGEGVVWAIVGGAGTLFGPIIGTTLFIVIREVVSTHWEHHSLIVGLMAILVVILAPKGLVGLWRAALDVSSTIARQSRCHRHCGSSHDRRRCSKPENLTRRFGGLTAVDNLSLTLPSGQLHAIIGPNGAGKTTLFNLISGLLRPMPGRCCSAAATSPAFTPHEISRLGIKRTLQVKSVFAQLTVAENLWITFEGSNRFLHPLRDAESDPVARERVERTLEQIGLTALARRQAGTLSYGDVALLEIGMALISDPQLLLLDEPTCGMSPAETERAVAKIREMARTIDIIIIEHDMAVVFGIADAITVMAQGAILASGNAKEISEDERVREAYLGRPEDEDYVEEAVHA